MLAGVPRNMRKSYAFASHASICATLPTGDNVITSSTEGCAVRSTERVSVAVPLAALARARETYPETRDMSAGRVLRYALAIALGESPAEALSATRDARLLVSRARSDTTHTQRK